MHLFPTQNNISITKQVSATFWLGDSLKRKFFPSFISLVAQKCERSAIVLRFKKRTFIESKDVSVLGKKKDFK